MCNDWWQESLGLLTTIITSLTWIFVEWFPDTYIQGWSMNHLGLWCLLSTIFQLRGGNRSTRRKPDFLQCTDKLYHTEEEPDLKSLEKTLEYLYNIFSGNLIYIYMLHV
jgi:hypothetical protein